MLSCIFFCFAERAILDVIVGLVEIVVIEIKHCLDNPSFRDESIVLQGLNCKRKTKVCPEDLAMLEGGFFTVAQVVRSSLLTMEKTHLVFGQRDIVDNTAILISGTVDKSDIRPRTCDIYVLEYSPRTDLE